MVLDVVALNLNPAVLAAQTAIRRFPCEPDTPGRLVQSLLHQARQCGPLHHHTLSRQRSHRGTDAGAVAFEAGRGAFVSMLYPAGSVIPSE